MKRIASFYNGLTAALIAFAMGMFLALTMFARAASEPFADKFGEMWLRWALKNGAAFAAVTYQDAYTGKFPVRVQPTDAGVYECLVPITFAATTYAGNDLIGLVRVPVGVRVVDWYIITDDMDTGGSPAIVFSIGTLDSISAPTDLGVTWKSGITIGQTGGVQRMDTTGAPLQAITAERAVALKVTTAAATYAASKTGILVLRLDTP